MAQAEGEIKWQIKILVKQIHNMVLIAPDCWTYGATIDLYLHPHLYPIDWSKIKVPEKLEEPKSEPNTEPRDEPRIELEFSFDPKSKVETGPQSNANLEPKPEVKAEPSMVWKLIPKDDLNAESNFEPEAEHQSKANHELNGDDNYSPFEAPIDFSRPKSKSVDVTLEIRPQLNPHLARNYNPGTPLIGGPDAGTGSDVHIKDSGRTVTEILRVVDSLNVHDSTSLVDQALSDCETVISESKVRYFRHHYDLKKSKSEPNSPLLEGTDNERIRGDQFSFVYDFNLEDGLNSKINIWTLRKIQYLLSRPELKGVPLSETWSRYIDNHYYEYMSAKLIVLLYAAFNDLREKEKDKFEIDDLCTHSFYEEYFYPLLDGIGIDTKLLLGRKELEVPTLSIKYFQKKEMFHPDPNSIKSRRLPIISEHPYVTKEKYNCFKYDEYEHGNSVHLIWAEWMLGLYGQRSICELEKIRSSLGKYGLIQGVQDDNLVCPIRRNILMFICYGHYYRGISPQISVDLLQSYLFFNESTLEWLSERMEEVFDAVYEIPFSGAQPMLVFQSDVPYQEASYDQI